MPQNENKNRVKMAVIGVAAVMVIAALAILVMNDMGKTDPMDLRITYSNKVDYEPLIIAAEKGFFKAEGLNVTALIVAGGIQSAEALATGSADLGAMGDAPGVTLMSQNQGVRLVASYGGGEGMHRLIAWTDIHDVTDLAGKKVGVQFGSSSQGALLRLLAKNGLNQTDITQVSLGPSDMPTAMKTRQVDAIIGSEPTPTNVQRICGTNVIEIANSTGLGSTYPLVLMASNRLVAEKPAAISAALRAIDHAIAYMTTDRDDSIAICASKTGLSVIEETRCLTTLTYNLSMGSHIIDSLNSTAQFLLENGKITVMPDILARTDSSFLAAIKDWGRST